MFEGQLPVNRFLVSETINGLCTAFMYTYVDKYGEAGGRPVLYSDNNNSPLLRRSKNEGFADFTVNSSKPAGWRSATFMSNEAIASGSYIWFGVFAEFFWQTRFDFGYKSYTTFWCDYGDNIPNTYPVGNVNWFSNFKLSMYFTYTLAQNYTRTITQGVQLTDNRTLSGLFNRKTAETIKVQDNAHFSFLFLRLLRETIKASDTLRNWRALFRGLLENVDAGSYAKTGRDFYVKLTETVQATGVVFRGLLLFVRIATGLFVRDFLLGRFLKANQELVLKSAISREITLESKIG
jgi:hypothetical protein